MSIRTDDELRHIAEAGFEVKLSPAEALSLLGRVRKVSESELQAGHQRVTIRVWTEGSPLGGVSVRASVIGIAKRGLTTMPTLPMATVDVEVDIPVTPEIPLIQGKVVPP